VYPDEFDGTPGSLLLGVRRMREQRYPALPEDGRRVLRALKLLRSAQTYVYPEARAALVASDFVRLGAADSAGRRALEPVADVYLERAVPDYPTAGASEADDWPRLRLTLERQRDAAALLSLGNAFSERPLGDRRANKEQAIACYRSAQEVYTRASDPVNWAQTQNNLGAALRQQSELAEGGEQARLLGEAVDAYHAALEVSTRASAPTNWAQTQNNLAIALAAQAALAEGAEQARLLGEAVDAYRAAQEVYTRASAPTNWATTQNNLGAALQTQVGLAEGDEQVRLLGEAVDASRAALEVYSRTSAPANWAATQNNLGVALESQGVLTEGAERLRLLGEAIACYRAALEVRTERDLPTQHRRTMENLARAEAALADARGEQG
jgi:tetratricopeptide (TPR) repeat protein